MAITADFAKGSSGAPVLNTKGEVVGMVSAMNSVYYEDDSTCPKNLQMVVKNCVPARYILNLIEGNGSFQKMDQRRDKTE